jgi:tetratricopeptide (TPR) repeat protein
MGKRDYEAAINVYRKALAGVSPTTTEALGLSYELAEAYIGHGNISEAYKLFARVCDVDPHFRDSRRRAKELELDLGSSAPPPTAAEKPTDSSVVKIPTKKTKISYI